MAGHELMELPLRTLLQIQLDRFPPENHNCCSAPTKTALIHKSKHGEFMNVTEVEGLAIKTLPLWWPNVPEAPDLGSLALILALLRTPWGQFSQHARPKWVVIRVV